MALVYRAIGFSWTKCFSPIFGSFRFIILIHCFLASGIASLQEMDIKQKALGKCNFHEYTRVHSTSLSSILKQAPRFQIFYSSKR